MKFEQFLESKGVSLDKLNESNERLYEAEDGFLADIMKKIKGRMAYMKCKGLMPKYAEAAMEANLNIIDFESYKKESTIEKKIDAIENKKGAIKDRDQKSKLIDQSKKLQDVLIDLKAKKEVVVEQKKNQLQRLADELDDEMANIENSDLKSLISMQKTEAGYAASEEGLTKKALMAKEKGSADTAQKAEDEKKALKEKADALLAKLGTAEDAAAGELEDIQIEGDIKGELEAFIKTGNDIKATKAQFKTLWDEADKLVPVTESEEFDFDSFYKSVSEEDLFEEEVKFKGPKEVLSHINAIPDKEGEGEDATDNTEAKQGLYNSLKSLTDTYKQRVEKNIEAKEAIKTKCDGMLAANPPQKVTKDMLTIAGYDPEDIKTTEEKDEEGKTKKVNTPGELIPAWKAAFNDPAEYGPLKAIAEVQAEIDEKGKKKEGEPADKDEVKDEKSNEEKKSELKNKLGELQDELSGIDETKPENDEKVKSIEDKIAEVQQQLTDLDKKKDEDIEENELFAIEEAITEISNMISSLKESSESAEPKADTTQAPKTIMKFADFIASRNN